MEAQASGAIVAAFATGAIPEVGGEPAILVGVGDIEGLTRSISELLNDPEEFVRRQDAGVKLAEERTWSRIAERQVRFYEEGIKAASSE